MNQPIKHCNNCEYRIGSFTTGKCMLSGFYCEIERKNPDRCGRQFENWQPRRTLLVRLKDRVKSIA